ncbi:MAG TPA: FixH family protein, partial [Rugosimonospora sp.]|nr:FixH family protein [Rugosimonospora sp.]
RSVLLELGIAAVVLGVTAALVSTSPSGHHDAAPAALAYGGPFTTTLKLADGGQVVIWIDPGRVGQNEIVADVRDAAGASRDVPEVRAQLSQPDIGAEPMTVTFRRVGPGQFVASGVQLPVTGRWRVDITVRTTDVDESSVSTNVTLS